MLVPNERFLELLTDVEPSRTTKTQAADAHTSIRDHLRTQTAFKDRYVSSFLAGSYVRDTAIRPRTTDDGQERPDVDIIIVTNFTQYDHRPDAVLREVERALADGGRGYPVKRINKRSVRVETSRADMDIVPVLQLPYGYMIADQETGSWLFTNPPAHTDWSVQQNQWFGDRFKPLVKMLKWWRRHNPTNSRRPKGFVLEVLVSMYGPPAETHYGEAFAQTLERIYNAYGTQVNDKPTIEDPAVHESDILAKVTVPQWRGFIDKVRVYAGIARRAQNEDDMEAATQQWRCVFGDRFKPTAKAASAAAYGGFAAAVAPSAGYTFPNDPVDPPRKPRGFA